MALQRAIVGARFRGQRITWKLSDSTKPDLRTATISAQRRVVDTGIVTAITGVLTPDPVVQDVFTWQYSAADVLNAGIFEVQFSAIYPNGLIEKSLPERWHVEDDL